MKEERDWRVLRNLGIAARLEAAYQIDHFAWIGRYDTLDWQTFCTGTFDPCRREWITTMVLADIHESGRVNA